MSFTHPSECGFASPVFMKLTLMNFCGHFMYQILSTFDGKCKKRGKNFVYAFTESAAFSALTHETVAWQHYLMICCTAYHLISQEIR